MGTVSDSLKLTKASLTVAPGEEEKLQAQQSSIPQQTSITDYSNTNSLSGFPSEFVRTGLLDFSCPGPVETTMKDSEHDLTQTGMSSGISSEAEKLPPTSINPCDNSHQGSTEHVAQVSDPLVDLTFTQSVAREPVNQDDSHHKPCDEPKKLTDIIDKAIQSLEVSHVDNPEKFDCHLGTGDSHSKDQEFFIHPPEKRSEKVKTSMTTSATSMRKSEGDEQQVILNLETGLHTHLERENRPREETSKIALTTSDQASGTHQQSSSPSKHLVCLAQQNKALEAQHLSSRFKETGTMTSLDESGFLAETRANRTLQDAAVQTVTSMESRSVCTSPSILATFLSDIPPSETLEQEKLCVTDQSNSNTNNPSAKLEGPREAPCHSDNKTKEHIHLSTSDSSNIPTFQEESKPTSSSATVYQTAPDNGISGHCFLPTSGDNKNICKKESQVVEMVTEGQSHIFSQSSPVAPKSKPVDQISTHTCNKVDVSLSLGQAENKVSESSVKNIHNYPTESSPGDLSCKLLSPDNELNKSDSLSGTEKESTTQAGKEGEMVGPSADVKPKVETKAEFLCPDAGSHNVGLANALTPTTGRKNQDKASEESKQTKAITSLELPAELMGDSSPNSGKRTPSRSVKASPRRASRVSEFLKEQRLNVTAAAAQVGFTPGEKKKHLGSDSKLQFKQSKQVRDVIWDDQGMTWEVYGASLDPESLGIAIQNHLQRQIREHEKLIKVQSNQNRKSISSDTSSSKKLKGRQHNVFQAMLQNLRRPNCCVHPAPSSVLD